MSVTASRLPIVCLTVFSCFTGRALADDFSLKMKIDCTAVSGAERLYDGGGFYLQLRNAGRDAALSDYDKSMGNYLNFPLPDGSCPVIEAVVPEASKPLIAYYNDMPRGCRVGVPLGALSRGYGIHDIRLMWRKTALSLTVDGEETDVDFLVKPIDALSDGRVQSSRVQFCKHGPAEEDAAPNAKEIVRPIQYWTGPGFNTWVGDVAVAFWRGRMHLFYLQDRRHHRSKGGSGGHFFAHISSGDLIRWVEHPVVTPIEDYWFSCGTGTPFVYKDRICLAYGIHSTRFVPRESTTESQMLAMLKKSGVMRSVKFRGTEQIPLGATWASSADGVRFEHSGIVFHTTQNPAIEGLSNGVLRLTAGYGGDTGPGGVWTSRTMDNWRKTEVVSPLTGDCPCPFSWNGWHYLLQGFTGFAMAKEGEAMKARAESDIYDGLSVPMVSEWLDNRRILAGWRSHPFKRGWGGWLVFRELVQREDGTLGTRFVPEIKTPSPVRTVRGNAREELRLEFRPDSNSGCPVVFSVCPAASSASFSDVCPEGASTKIAEKNLSTAQSFRVTGIRGLEREYEVRYVVHYDRKADATLFDFEIAGNRTLIARREGKYSAACSARGCPQGLLINEDNDHFFKMPSSWMSREGLCLYLDEVLRGQVTHFIMCVNGQRTSYASETWEPIWMGLNEPAREDTATNPDGTHDRWAVNAKMLFDRGVDPYEVWIGECRKRGVEAWVSMRMNDYHFADVTNYFRNTTFCRSRKDLWVEQNPTNWAGHALDYAKLEVRDYNLKQVREICRRWDADGIELDWMRSPPHFRANEGRANAAVLTAFMREVRAETERVGRQRGRKYKLVVRVPSSLEVALATGIDVPAWVREGLVDALVPSNLFYPDPSLPIGEWVDLVKNENPEVKVYPCVNCFHHKNAESIRKSAAAYEDAGVEGVYLFNAPYVGKRDTDGRKHKEDSFGEICQNGLFIQKLK